VRHLSFLVYTIAAILLLGCVSSTSTNTTAVDVTSSQQDKYISTIWITKYRTEVTSQIIDYVQSLYPDIPSGLPNLEVGSVLIKNDVRDFNKANVKEIEPILRELLQEVSDKALKPSGTETLLLDVEIAFLTPSRSQAKDAAALVTLMPLCWGTLFVACPNKTTNYVSLSTKVKKHGKVIGQVQGIGGATRTVSSVLVDDASDPKANGTLKANTQALAAAVADLGGKLKPYLINAQHH